jgi:hypothetical protein
MASVPVVQSSGLADGLISLREMILNQLSGVSQSLVINNQVALEPLSPSADLATRLKSTLTELTGSVLDASGTAVDYAALRDSEVYADYRQECLAALRQFDPHWLPSLEAARAFWINLYNALVLDAIICFGIQKSVTEGFLGTLFFFRRAAYLVGGQRVSLEDIEHGILRGNRGNPYVPGVHFTSNDPRLAWSLPLDPRIHFALNCGGRSCPPIRAYEVEKLDQQLDLAARGFIDTTVEVRPERKEVVLSPIFHWYAADFGGRKRIIRFLIDHLPDDKRRRALLSKGNKFRFAYTSYDWRLNIL